MKRTPRRRHVLVGNALLLMGLGCLMIISCARRPAATFEVVEPPLPRIDSVTHGAPGGARPGDTVSITIKGDSGLKASASLGSLAPSTALAEDPAEQGLYRGSLIVPEGKTGRHGLTGKLEADTNTFSVLAGPDLTVLAPPPPPEPPKPSKVAAAELNAQKVLKTIYFDFDRYNLRPDALETLAANVQWLRGNTAYRIVLEGHCDERGTNEYNMALGDKRANAARDYLVNAGIEATRIRTISYGEERPADPGRNEQAWAKNRRVEFVLED